ncbi:MAG: hypothetical protein RL685_4440 [Pseudomonadota bacterium]|jgi:hypothetical protein
MDALNRFPSSRLVNRQTFSGTTGTMAAALASGACVCAARYPSAGVGKTLLHRLHVHYVCLGAFTTPVTAGRSLILQRGSGGDPSGGNALDIFDADTIAAVNGSELLAGRIATTAALTVAGITFEAAPRARLLLAQAGESGKDYDEIWDLSEDPMVLAPGQLWGLCAGQLFDAGGSWQLSVKGEAIELG